MLNFRIDSKKTLIQIFAFLLGLTCVTPAFAKKMIIQTPTDDIVLVQHKEDPNVICIGSNNCSKGFNITATSTAKNHIWWSGIGHGTLSTLAAGSLAFVNLVYFTNLLPIQIHPSPDIRGLAYGTSTVLGVTLGSHFFNQTRQKVSTQKALNKIIKFFNSDGDEDLTISTAGIFDLDESGTVFLRNEDTRLGSIDLIVEASRTMFDLIRILADLDRQ